LERLGGFNSILLLKQVLVIIILGFLGDWIDIAFS